MGTITRARLLSLASIVSAACTDPIGLPPAADETSTSSTGDVPLGSSTDSATTGGPSVPPSPPTRDEESSTGDPPPDLGTSPPGDPPPGFTVVTEAAGLDVEHGDFRIAPFCLLDDVEKPVETGDFCIPERFLGAAAAADYDEDGWVDFYLTSQVGGGRLMRSRGDGTFEDVTLAAGLQDDAHVTGGVLWADVDGDGDLDLLRTSLGATRNFLHVNEGGTFVEDAVARGFAVDTGQPHVGMGIAVGDYDLDGWLDVFVSDWHPDDPLGNPLDHNRLLHNLGPDCPGCFEDVTEAMGIDLRSQTDIVDAKDGSYGFGPAFVDLDGDGWPELTLAADFGTSRLWWNEAGLSLTDLTFESGVGTERNGMGSTFGDYDGDGDLDWFVSAIETPEFPQLGNRMYRNEGARQLLDVTDALGLRDGGWAWGTAFMDFEHDGDLDLALAAGWPSTPFYADPVRLWRNDDPAGPWPDRAVAFGVVFARQGRGLLPFDYDRDGDLDLFVMANTEIPALYRNDQASGHWLVIEAVGAGPNTRSLGAKVRVQAVEAGPWQVREIGVGSHFFGQQEAVAHFGVGEVEVLHRVEVQWPATGQVQVLESVVVDQRVVVYE